MTRQLVSGFDNPPLFIQIATMLNTPEIAGQFEKYLIKEYKTCPSEDWRYKKGNWVNRS